MRYVCYDQSAKFYSLILIFSRLCVVHDLIFIRKLSRKRLPITFVYFVSHASAQADHVYATFCRTTRHLISIQLLWKPKILNVENERTKFERSKGDLGSFSESCKWSLTRAQLSKHITHPNSMVFALKAQKSVSQEKTHITLLTTKMNA